MSGGFTLLKSGSSLTDGCVVIVYCGFVVSSAWSSWATTLMVFFGVVVLSMTVISVAAAPLSTDSLPSAGLPLVSLIDTVLPTNGSGVRSSISKVASTFGSFVVSAVFETVMFAFMS